jgi:hypothetical protein
MMQKKYPIKLHFGRGISRLSISLSTPIKLYFGRGFATLGKIVRDVSPLNCIFGVGFQGFQF